MTKKNPSNPELALLINTILRIIDRPGALSEGEWESRVNLSSAKESSSPSESVL